MTLAAKYRLAFDDAGFLVMPDVLTADAIDDLLPEFERVQGCNRIITPSLAIRSIASPNGALGSLACVLGGSNSRPVRILAFDKTPERNWALGWHQDRVISVRERRDVPGFDLWTEKAGVPHVEPPEDVLKNMFSLRLHLDDCGVENGALKVVPGSWSLGRVDTTTVARVAEHGPVDICTARRGGVLAMRALTLHASDAAVIPTRRRVLHVDYAMCELPGGLAWSLPMKREGEQCT